MIKHFVFAVLKDATEENFEAVSRVMLSAKENIHSVKEARIDRDILHTPMSFDILLTLEFDNPEGLQEFVSHPYHMGYMLEETNKYVKEIRLIDIVAG